MSTTPPPSDPPEPPRDEPPTAETARMTSGDPLGAGPERPAGEGAAPPPPPPASGPRRVYRSRDDRTLFGVAGGIAAHLGVDALLVRLAFILLAFAGGAGVVAYLAAALLVPAAPAGTPPAHAAGASPDRRNLLTVVLAVIVVIVAGPVLVPFVLLGLAGLAVTWLATGRRPVRDPRRLVGDAGLGVLVLLGLGVLSVAAFWTAGLGGGVVVAVLVIAAGVALLAGAAARPVRWLALPALAVAIPAGVVAAAGIELDGGLGEKTYRPAAAAQVADRYELGAGRLLVDLREADLPPGDRELRLEVGMGEAVLVVPGDVCVATDARIGMGLVELFDDEDGGVDVAVTDDAAAPAGTTRLLVDAQVGLGHLDVRHTEPVDDDDDRRWDAQGGGWRSYAPLGDGDLPGNEACAGAG